MNENRASGFCALCGASARLEQSHIIPRFVSRGLQVPDGPTRPLLCGECEDLFSGYESTFARVVFHPWLMDSRLVAKYDKWLLKFAASVCWRVLEERPAADQPAQTACRETWRRFLAGKRPDVGAHAIHLLPADRNAGGEAIEMAVSGSADERFVYAKLGPLILLGLISDPAPAQWRGTRIHLEGKIKPRETSVPARYRNYLLARANRHG